jgi:hypothetical protein
MLIYDVEIKKAILGKHDDPVEGIEYCEGWGDHLGMGVSTVCCYDYSDGRYRVFCEDNLEEFWHLIDDHDVIAGFNNIKFDNKVLAHAVSHPDMPAEKILEHFNSKSYDIFAEIRKASGMMCGLDATVKANGLGTGKTGNGAMAPVWYQTGQWGVLIDYCIADVWLTKNVLDLIILQGKLINPRNGKEMSIKKP